MQTPKTLPAAALLFACLFAPLPCAADDFGLKAIVPSEAQLAVAWRQNPEREPQREQLAKVIQAFQQERIAERVFEIIKSRVEADDLEEAQQALQQFQEATASASLAALADAQEAAFYQITEGESVNNVVAVRMTPEAVNGYIEAARKLLAMAEEKSGDQFSITEEQVDGATYLTLYPPAPAPMQPTLVGKDGVLLFSTSQSLARAAVLRLGAGTAESKFDEPRLKDALAELPRAEDTVYFYDGKQHFQSLRKQLAPALEAIKQQADGDANAAAAVRLINALIEEIAVTDLEVAVGYTDEARNRTDTFGMMLPGTDERILRQVVDGGQPFENWGRWTPADAAAFRLSSGVDLHAVYTRFLDIFSREAPELAAEALVQLTKLEDQLDLNLEGDLLTLFSGESVSVTLPDGQSFAAFKCNQPEHTRELLHRAIDAAVQIPQVAQQQLELVESESLPGFEDLRASFFAAVGVRPVIGFKEGWMIIASTPEAAQQVIDVRWGEAESFASSESYKKLGLAVDGPVSAISYSNTAGAIRKTAQYINQAAAMAPLFAGAVLQNADPKDVETVQKVIALLPSVARVIEKLDFMEAQLSVQYPGQMPDTYRKANVMLIRED